MKQFNGMSQTGDLKEALKGLVNPSLIILISNEQQFDSHVAELEGLFPKVPSIGCVGAFYEKKAFDKGVGVVAFCEGVTVATNVLEQVSVMPVKYIKRMKQDLQKVQASSNNTVCIDFCTGNDACAVTTMYSLLGKQNIQLLGGTAGNSKVSVNGQIYEDALVYALVKNQGGKVKVYRENIYAPSEDNCRFVASKTDRSKYMIGALNGQPAKKVYQDTLHIKESDIVSQTFQNPIGKIYGKDICIISIKEVAGDALVCYRQVNDSDVLVLLELLDYKQVAKETVQMIKKDFSHISGVFAVNCILRYLLFVQNHNVDDYLSIMGGLNNFAGFVGNGEHFNGQFVNQSMVCAVFE